MGAGERAHEEAVMHDPDTPGRVPDPVEEASRESFPASDPPAWTAARVGKPKRAGKQKEGASKRARSKERALSAKRRTSES